MEPKNKWYEGAAMYRMKSFVINFVRQYLGAMPIIRGILFRIDSARQERDQAFEQYEIARKELDLMTMERDKALKEIELTGIKEISIIDYINLLAKYNESKDFLDKLNQDFIIAMGELEKLKKVPLFVVPGHYYSPIVDPNLLQNRFNEVSKYTSMDNLSGINLNRNAMVRQWQALLPYLKSCPFTEFKYGDSRYQYENPSYSYGDGSILHAMIRHYKPKRIVEIGSGWSSACTIDTVERFLDNQCDLVFIEPYTELLESLIGSAKDKVRIYNHEVQQVPLGVFEELEYNDILFIDSTHVMKTGSDVCFELFEILPILKPGVIVHFHDIFYPFEYPIEWAINENRSWNEIYGLHALLMDSSKWNILFFNNYFAIKEEDLILDTFPLFLKNSGGALWLVKN